MKGRFRKILRYGRNALLLFFLSFVLCDALFPLKINLLYSTLVLSEEGHPLAAYLSSDDKWRLYLEEDEVSDAISEAFLLKEDRYFYFHPGFNPIAIIRASIQNIGRGKHVSGASTITMQLVRLIKPRERTYLNKAIEIWEAMQLEWHYSKDEILRMYLNLVPYGGNIEGIKSASYLYFQCLPNQLSPAQIATLAVVPNRPNTWKLRPNNAELRDARNRWLTYFYEANWMDLSSYESALDEPLSIERKSWEQVAPHLCRRLYSQYQTPIIHSHIRYSAQRKTEALVKQYIERLKTMRITNAAVIVIENESRKVIAYAGSADYGDKENDGEVDGILAIRSPGSTLKPFVYGLSMEKGVLNPKSILYDVPSNYAGYTPENYDLHFQGALTAQSALAKSLNIPAVSVLQQYGVPLFIQKMGEIDFRQIKSDQKRLGLSLVLGGCGVRLESLTNGYATLANQGSYRPLRYVQSDSTLLQFEWIKPEAAFMVSEILSGLTRPDLPSNWQMGKSVPRIAWKTGTSYGRRDAWSIGYNDEYTIGVWIGNFDNEGVPGLNGAEMATPLLFQLFDAIQGKNKTHWLHAPEQLSIREICTETGQVPGPYCTNLGQDYFIPGISRHIPCTCRKKIPINESKTLSYCMSCKPSDGTHEELFRIYPPSLIRYFEDAKLTYEKVPTHNPACPRIFVNEGPNIVSPTDQAEYLIEQEEKAKLHLIAEVDARVKEIYWYVNDKLVGSCLAKDDFVAELPNGAVKISCTDDQGRTNHIYIQVKRF